MKTESDLAKRLQIPIEFYLKHNIGKSLTDLIDEIEMYMVWQHWVQLEEIKEIIDEECWGVSELQDNCLKFTTNLVKKIMAEMNIETP